MKINIILMAGGNSIRFGENKLLYNYKGKSLFEIALSNILKGFENSSYDFNIIVVTQYKEILDIVEKSRFSEAVYSVYSPESSRGVSFTIRNGILSEREKSDFYMFAVCDQPFMKSETYINLFKGTLNSNKGIGSVQCNGAVGNPVVFSEKYRDELLGLDGGTGGRKIVKKHIDDVYYFDILDDREIFDIDSKDNIY